MIEWANLIEEILPDHYREITIEKTWKRFRLQKNNNFRQIEDRI